MFEVGCVYWFKLKVEGDFNKEFVNIKGEVIEENQYMVKIKRDDGNIEIIPFVRILNMNKEKEVEDDKTGRHITEGN